jgi:hypothetical protein
MSREPKGERVDGFDLDEYPIAILFTGEINGESGIVHVVFYPSEPTDEVIIALRDEAIEEKMFPDGIENLRYTILPSEDFMDILNKAENGELEDEN